ncbi:MAG: hypothetical protein KIT22_19070, partial [Verrucomicrobiae bacterium]|nr:hypothetical protein [Verrucomicrobiae bacterium]
MKRLWILFSVIVGGLGMGMAFLQAQDPKPEAKPAADEVAVLKFKDYGEIVLEFWPEVAPKTV